MVESGCQQNTETAAFAGPRRQQMKIISTPTSTSPILAPDNATTRHTSSEHLADMPACRRRERYGQSRVIVSDLRHFLDMPDDAPGPARRMAQHLTMIVGAATAGDAGLPWVSALPCIRRPNHRACSGNLVLQRVDVPSSIEWQCANCGDDGVISGWEHSPFDLRRRDNEQSARQGVDVRVSPEVVHTLRGLTLLDTTSEQIVFRDAPHTTGSSSCTAAKTISTSCSATSQPKPTTSTTGRDKNDLTRRSRSSTTRWRTQSVRRSAHQRLPPGSTRQGRRSGRSAPGNRHAP